ncbi:putative membrane protein [Desulfosporosinus orientis DSM 765]|uniref:Putative membrane protein n=1 Tax=Desulfosporosinus orientis (strain ATCC 19365 / DSM 765 / NCIMB 8382 / VKM B-1628 / Singapore I) TaxID=768706 RepID=G7WJI8_DESOD|nr:phage holin family protein [Desulfosporosinus orientis]AET70425.1 putative membrane protein [Desulfosporosinus orientis DSM 765]
MIGMIVRFVVSAVVLLLVSWIVPGLRVNGFTGALIAAAVIAILGYGIERLFGDKVTRMGRGSIGFLTAAVVIYFSQFLVPGSISVSIIGALLASLVIGIVDSFVPTTLR